MLRLNKNGYLQLAGTALLGIAMTGCASFHSHVNAQAALAPVGETALIEFDGTMNQPFQNDALQDSTASTEFELFLANTATDAIASDIELLIAGDAIYLRQKGVALMLRLDPQHSEGQAVQTNAATASAAEAEVTYAQPTESEQPFFVVGDLYSLGF